MTYDKRFVIKTIRTDEEKVLGKIIEDYKDHFQSHTNTFIVRIIGYFVFDFEISSQNLRVIVFENVFKGKPSLIKRRFDMKGSTFSRQIIKDYSEVNKLGRIKETLKDIDFDEIEKEIILNNQDKNKVIK